MIQPSNQDTVLLTGATGLVGSQLLPVLRKQGYRVFCLVRDKAGASAQKRISLAGDDDQIQILSGDVAHELCGLSSQQITALCGHVEKVIHSAALLKFDEALAPEINKVNVNGTKNVLELAKALGAKEFHYVSTAYVAGKASQFSESDIGLAENARNPYEHSKQRAEELVRQWPDRAFSIYRLGIVIGNSETGFTPSWDGYYGYFSPFWHLRDKLQQLGNNSTLFVHVAPSMSLNLVPVDWVVEMLGHLVEVPTKGQAFHLTHPAPQALGWVVENSFRIMGLPVACSPTPVKADFHGEENMRRIINRSIERYAPYVGHEANFCNANLRQVLNGKYSPPVKISEQLLKDKILAYAMQKNFGRDEE